jgi:outer membrane protein
MKQFSLILNIVLVLAVGYLFYARFTDCKKCEKTKKVIPAKVIKNGAASTMIAYVDLDSLNEKIDYIKSNRKSLEAEQVAIETEWENGYRSLENQKNTFLKRGNSITQSEAEEFQAKLIQQQQVIDNKKQTLSQKLNEKSYKFMDDIQKKLKSFLAEYNQDNRYTYIFTTGNGLDYLVFKDEAYNITNDVIAGMNENLNAESK